MSVSVRPGDGEQTGGRGKRRLALAAAAVAIAICVVLVVRQCLPWRQSTAVAILEVRPLPAVGAESSTDGPSQGLDLLTRTHARMITTDAVLERVLENPAIRETTWFKEDSRRALGRLRSSLTASWIEATNLISLSMTGRTRHDVIAIVDVVAETYVQHARQIAHMDVIEQIEVLDQEHRTLQGRLDGLRSDARRVRSTIGEADPDTSGKALSGKLRQLSADRVRLELAESKAVAAVKAAEELAGSGVLGGSPEVLRAVATDSELQSLQTQAAALSDRHSSVAADLGAEDEQAEALAAELDQVRKKSSERQSTLKDAAVEAILKKRRSAVAVATRQLQQARAEFDRAVASLNDLAAARRKLQDITKRQSRLGERVDKIKARIAELNPEAEWEPVLLRQRAVAER